MELMEPSFYDINSNEKDPNKTKRIRTRFTVEQLEKLEGNVEFLYTLTILDFFSVLPSNPLS